MKILKEDYLKYLLPLVAVAVIIESVVLITGMEDRKVEKMPIEERSVVESGMVKEGVPEGEPMVSLSFATESRMVEVGKDYKVEVNLTALKPVALDSLELYMTYDPEAFEISGLTTENDLPTPAFAKISDKQDLVVVNYMVMEEGGFVMDRAQVSPLMAFNIRPLKTGSFDLGFATGQDGETSVTMFVGNESGQALPFSVNDLNIKVE
jgi:hypothetical protein